MKPRGGKAMTIKTTTHQRHQMYKAHLSGQSYAEIAETHGLSSSTVRRWCRRQRDGGSVRTEWHRPKRGALSRFEPIIRYVILRLRLDHPRWGPGTILVHLHKRPSLTGMKLPSRPSIGRYLNQWQRFRRPRRRKSTVALDRPAQPTRVHECWQIDFKLGIKLEADTQVNLHTVTDQVSSACMTTQLTDAGKARTRPTRVTETELQATLRTAFHQWQTLPEIIQTDNEAVFVGHTSDHFPSRFTLWLTGLGIVHRRIRAGRPTDNAQVERNHQTVCNYAIIGNEALSRVQLQDILERSVEELAHELPSRAANCQGRPPVHAYPELIDHPNVWRPEREVACFDLKRVDRLLASSTWQRRVGKNGQVSIGAHHRYYSVGRPYAGDDVHVCFDPDDRHFVFFLVDNSPSTVGPEVARRPARYLSVEDIIGLHDDDTTVGPQQLRLSFPESQRGQLLMSN